MYILVKRLKESQKTLGKSKSSHDSDTALIIQLTVITTSNILSWFPADGIYIAAMFLSTYPVDLILRAAVLGMPINSVMNPFVLIIMFVKKYILMKKDQNSHQTKIYKINVGNF